MGFEASQSVMGVLENLNNIIFVKHYYRFQLLQDEDDDKFADCAIASNADFIVTHDKDFNILKSIEFPKVRVIDTHELRDVLKIRN